MTRKIITNDGKVLELPRLKAQEWVDAKAAKFFREDIPAAEQVDPTDVPVKASPASEKSAPAKPKAAPAKSIEKTTD